METLDETYYTKVVEEYVSQKRLLSSLETKVDKLKKELSAVVDSWGTPDDNGHRWLSIGGHELKRERRVSKNLDATSATQWAKDNGYWDDIKEIVEVMSESKLTALAWENKELLPTVQAFYVEKETWAFKA